MPPPSFILLTQNIFKAVSSGVLCQFRSSVVSGTLREKDPAFFCTTIPPQPDYNLFAPTINFREKKTFVIYSYPTNNRERMVVIFFLSFLVSFGHARSIQVPSNEDYDNNVMWIDSLSYLTEVLTANDIAPLVAHHRTYSLSLSLPLTSTLYRTPQSRQLF
jgi:hypothetical protein